MLGEQMVGTVMCMSGGFGEVEHGRYAAIALGCKAGPFVAAAAGEGGGECGGGLRPCGFAVLIIHA